MATVTLAYNHARDPMNPDDLGNKIAVALGLTTLPVVDINATQIVVTHASVTSANTAAIQAVVNAYVLDPTWAGGVGAVLLSKAQTAIQTDIDALALADPTSNNNTYLASPTLVASATAAQVQAYVRLMDTQLRALTNQNNSIIAQLRAITRQVVTLLRVALSKFDSTEGT